MHFGGDLIHGVLRVAPGFAFLTEGTDCPAPRAPVLSCQMIQRLGSQAVLKQMDAHAPDPPVLDPGLEILFRQRLGRGHHHAAFSRMQHLFKHPGLKHEIPVHQEHIPFHRIPCQVHRIDIIGGIIARVVHIAHMQRKMHVLHVPADGLVKSAGGDHNILHPVFPQQPELSFQNGFPVFQLRHALGMGSGKVTHP